jgi:class 3 adenylate cyclase/tetratricopeptide (TPR) repeat protein
MQCSRCQRDNDPTGKFCEGCGTRLARKCSECGTDLSPDAHFCKECGAPVVSGQSTPSSPPAPEAYTPKHLAERILTSRAALEGERKQVTVLFADLKGSMELLADRDPEEARAILDPVLERMMEAVHRYEGTVNQVMGDGIMALFGAPLAHEDHAVRACYAALRMQEAVKGYAQELQRTEGAFIQIRVGLNSGEVVVGSIGSDLRMDYTAVGQTTHLAARMEQMAMPGSILLAPDTLQLAEGYVQVNALGPMAVKGLSGPIAVCELLGASTARSRLQAAANRGLTKFVGRDTELETLRRTLEQAGNGQGQIVALVGEPGVGKSRLVWEFTHSHRTQGWLVLASGSVSYGKATSYLPVIDLLKSYCGIEDRDDARRIRERVTGKLLTLDPVLQPMQPAFLALLDVPVEDADWQALDPPQRRQRTLDACKRLLLRESQVQPLLLVFEDLHWIDAETQALLDSLVESLPTARILLLVNYRPEYEHAWHRKMYYQQLRLDPLPPESAEELLAALMGDAAGLEPLKRLLIERTEGNPFFVEESVRTLVEGGVLTGERGSYRLVRPFESTHVPATVQAVLAARIDRLAPEDKRLLQSAAVIGKDVPYPLLRALVEPREDALRQALARLQAAEFLYETRLYPDPEYTFKHALTHEVAYGGLLHERRRALHAEIVEAIERLYADRLAEQVERLAHHALRGEVWDTAVAYCHQAAVKAEAHGAYRETVTYFEYALDALKRLPETRETAEQGIDLRFGLRAALVPLGEEKQAIQHLRDAELTAEALGDHSRLGRVSIYLSHYYWWVGDYSHALESGQRALAIAGGHSDFTLEIESNYHLGLTYHLVGDYRRAVDSLTRNIEALKGDLTSERLGMIHLPAASSRGWLARALGELGEFPEAVARAEEAVHLADALGHPFTRVFAYRILGGIRLQKGDLEQAIPWLDRAMDLCRHSQIRNLFPAVATWASHALALSGRIAEALPLAEQAIEQSARIDFVSGRSLSLTLLGEAYRMGGQGDRALAIAREALELARQHSERGHEAWALRLQGEIAACVDPPDTVQAESYYREALALAEELGMRPLAAHCHRGLGTLYRQVGRDEQAQAELATAAQMYRGMEMSFWLERAQTELGQSASAP